MTGNLYDKTGREIKPGDVLKVFHFTGRRRKRYYMYKQALKVVTLGRTIPEPYIMISHLDMSDGYYVEQANGRVLDGYEIVQGADGHPEDRPQIIKEGRRA